MVYQCVNGHKRFSDDCVVWEDGEECSECGEMLKQVTDPYELMAIAEETGDCEDYHVAADEALYQMLLQSDNPHDVELAKRYKAVRDKGFWYA